jgi:hypothetical protein
LVSLHHQHQHERAPPHAALPMLDLRSGHAHRSQPWGLPSAQREPRKPVKHKESKNFTPKLVQFYTKKKCRNIEFFPCSKQTLIIHSVIIITVDFVRKSQRVKRRWPHLQSHIKRLLGGAIPNQF